MRDAYLLFKKNLPYSHTGIGSYANYLSTLNTTYLLVNNISSICRKNKSKYLLTDMEKQSQTW